MAAVFAISSLLQGPVLLHRRYIHTDSIRSNLILRFEAMTPRAIYSPFSIPRTWFAVSEAPEPDPLVFRVIILYLFLFLSLSQFHISLCLSAALMSPVSPPSQHLSFSTLLYLGLFLLSCLFYSSSLPHFWAYGWHIILSLFLISLPRFFYSFSLSESRWHHFFKRATTRLLKIFEFQVHRWCASFF